MKTEKRLNDTMHGQSDHVCMNGRCKGTQNKGKKVIIIMLIIIIIIVTVS